MSRTQLLSAAASDVLGRLILSRGLTLFISGSLAVPLAANHQMPVAPSSCDNQRCPPDTVPSEAPVWRTASARPRRSRWPW